VKLLFIDASRNGWGTEQHLVSLVGALKANGHTVAAVVKARSVVAETLDRHAIRTYPTAFRGGADPRGILATLRAIRRESPDWIITSRAKLYWTVWLLGRLTGVRVALFRHMADVRPWLSRCVLPALVDRFIVVSQFARQHLVAGGAPADKIDVLHNPIGISQRRSLAAHRAEARLRLGVGAASSARRAFASCGRRWHRSWDARGACDLSALATGPSLSTAATRRPRRGSADAATSSRGPRRSRTSIPRSMCWQHRARARKPSVA
jgi:hypothetical protein